MICVRWRAGGHARHRGTWTSAGLSDARVHAAVRVCGPAMRVVRAHLWRHRPDGVGLEHFVRARRLEAEKMMLRVPQRRETCAPSRTRQSEIAHCRRASGVCEVRARALRAWRRAARRLASPPTWRSRAARTPRQATQIACQNGGERAAGVVSKAKPRRPFAANARSFARSIGGFVA
jgi:hypothetical protein